jgi:hypothetical protein
MDMIPLPPDFKDLLKLLKNHDVKYLLVGGYAVAYHGYPRSTGDMDIWIQINPENAQKMVRVLKSFGFDTPDLDAELFLTKRQIIRMGIPPVRIEIMMDASGVVFDDCYQNKIVGEIDGTEVHLISLEDLKKNKKASGRFKDLNDLENLPSEEKRWI